eukprot:13514639-Heterocapsa_arctica.AAC.1
MPVENDAAKRLYEATAAGGTAGPNGTASVVAQIHTTDASGRRCSNTPRYIHVLHTDHSPWPINYPSQRTC